LPAVLVVERAGVRQEVALHSRDGEVRIRLGARTRNALEGVARISVKFPFITVSSEGLELRMACGLNRAWLSDGRPAWLPDAPKLDEGIPSLTPRTLRMALALLGVRGKWLDGGMRLAIGDGAPPPAVPALPPANPRPVPAARPFTPYHVVLDPGHGGEDCGARSRRGLCEKEVTLDLALRVRRLLEAKGLRITMTREDDRKLTLEQRVEIAQQAGADLFVSLHINSSPNRSAKGVETYVYGQSVSSRTIADLVRRENAEADYVDIIVNDLQQRLHHDSSIRVAGSVEDELVRQLNVQGRSGKRVKEAPFYVLARARRPAVLLEIGFISNSVEEGKMRGTGWRQRVAESIADGLAALGKAGAGARGG
jgi:N-acetylmuramoyl-L-alanine amidase